MKLAVVMVTYNSAAVVKSALASLAGQLQAQADIYVVDNASSDDTVARVNAEFPSVQILQNTENLGFGAANNRAFSQMTADFALLLNPDTVAQDGAVDALLRAAERYPNAAIIAPLIHTAQGEVERSFKWDVFRREHHKAIWQVPEGDVSVAWVSGAAMLLNMRLMREVGFFDTNIFFYHEDDDLCLRVRKAGHEVVVVPQAVITHTKGASSPPSPELDAWKQKQLIISRLYLERKYYGSAAEQRLARRICREAKIKIIWYGLLKRKRKQAKHSARFHAARDVAASASKSSAL